MFILRKYFGLTYYTKNARQLYNRYIAPYKNVIRCEGNPDNTLLREWIPQLGNFEKIVVVARGPSAVRLQPSARNLHIVINGSFSLLNGPPFIYFVSDGFYVTDYLKHGAPLENWRGTVFREETCSGGPSTLELARMIHKYKQRFRRIKPEVFASDLFASGPARTNYDELEVSIRRNLGLKFKQFNSGFGAIQIGFYLAIELGIPLTIYGLDAGIGGNVHFDGSASNSKAVSGDRVREKLTVLLDALYTQSMTKVTNYSYFHSNEHSKP